MSFLRDEARAALWRWREVLSGLAALGLGLNWALRGGPLLVWVGVAVLAAGAALVAVGVPRGRFRTGGDGPGVVQITEGRVSYFGPLTGGSADLAELAALAHDARGLPAHWELMLPGRPSLFIPVTASGADALFDAFQTLPGLSTPRLIAAARQSEGRQTVWRRPE